VKKMAVGSACEQSIGALAAMVSSARSESGNIPSMSDLSEENPKVKYMLNNTEQWVQDGAPRLESTFDNYVITGWCADGKKYEYRSETGRVTSEPFK